MSEPTPEDIENLIEQFKRSDWEEMHLKTDTLEVFLSNDPAARAPVDPGASPVAPPAAADVVPGTAEAVATTPPAASTAPSQITIPEGMVAVRAPNLGTFYRAPKPGAPAYVEVGQQIDADTEVCLIEVMKLFTPVKAGVAGTVREVCVDDAAMVEFEQVLVIIEPA
ncbi:MAG: acetyl-CoA carboxylase biotin carboxyl carrier protein [Gammaproteobacteria bacterium]